ncbi:MAG TPA: (2Fe-2S)-binding protein [Candidatus Merdenecus merdavium]|nr:(2Fe-2S)-binding protein [Candidatus Merdenecus merdavium]
MGYITIDSKKVEFTDEKNILSIIRRIGIDLPTFCYHSELSTYGACRMCVVEDDRGRIMASCSEQPWDGMVIYTKSPKVMKHRKMILELLLSSHCRDCTTCDRNGDCTLQDLAAKMGIKDVRFKNTNPTLAIDDSSPSIVRDPNKCILCGDCVRTCGEVQGIGAIDFAMRGSKAQVMPAFDKKIIDTDCVGCGQCRVVCPTAAITIKSDIERVWDAINDKNTRVVAQIAPAVRVAIGDKFGIPKGENSLGKLVAAMRYLGFDEVYDTTFGADLTVMEESKELLAHIESGVKKTMYTSCCPGWVKFCENKYPEMRGQLSSCRSPQQMFGATIKEYYRDETKSQGKRTVMVSVMPCTAKKGEAIRPEHKTKGEQDVDIVITTTEMAKMIDESGLIFDRIEPESTDMPFGLISGGGVLFGVTGGVTEAVLRRLLSHEPSQDAIETIKYSGVRGLEGIKEATMKLGEKEVKIAVVSGLANASELIDKINAGEVYYDFVEVMACRRGCILGGGQPRGAGPRTKEARSKGLYQSDKQLQIKRSNENPMILALYDGLLKDQHHELLHDDLECYNEIIV